MKLEDIKATTTTIIIDYTQLKADGFKSEWIATLDRYLARERIAMKLDGPFLDDTLRISVTIPPPAKRSGNQITINRIRKTIYVCIRWATEKCKRDEEQGEYWAAVKANK